jgi:hypothetical protein
MSGSEGELLAAIRGWEAARQRQAQGHSIKRRAAAKLGSFLGPRAAGRLLEPVSEAGDNLLPAIEPVLATFLGRRAAADLAGHIAMEVVVRL